MYQCRVPGVLSDLVERGFRMLYSYATEFVVGDNIIDQAWAANNADDAEPTACIRHLFDADRRAMEVGLQSRHEDYCHRLHTYMDYALDAHRSALSGFLSRGDTTAFWRDFWHIVEQSTIHFTGTHHDTDISSFCGRDKSLIVKRHMKPTCNRELNGNFTATAPKWVQDIATQANRCTHLSACFNILRKNLISEPRREALQHDTKQVVRKLMSFAAEEVQHPGGLETGLAPDVSFRSRAADLVEIFADRDVSYLKLICLLDHAAARYKAIHHAQLQRLRTIYTEARKAKLRKQQSSVGAMCRAL